MQYAIIENNTIANVAEADAPLADNWELLQAGAGIGWTRTGAGQQFEAPAAAPDPVPATCTRRQGRLALLQAGKLDMAEGAIASIADPAQKRAAQIEYEADTWERSNAFLVALWLGMGGALPELDALFVTAETL